MVSVWDLAKVVVRRHVKKNHRRTLKAEIIRDLKRAITWRHKWSYDYDDGERIENAEKGNSPLLPGRRWLPWNYQGDRYFTNEDYPGAADMLSSPTFPREMLDNSTYNRMLAVILEQFWAEPPIEIDFDKPMPAMDAPTEGNNVTTPALTEFFEAQFQMLFGTTDPKPADDAVGDGAMPSRHISRLASQDRSKPAAPTADAKRRRTSHSDTDDDETGTAAPATTTKAAAAPVTKAAAAPVAAPPAAPAAEPPPAVPPANVGYQNLPCYGCLCQTCRHCRAEGHRLDMLNATGPIAKAAAAPIAKPPPAPSPVAPAVPFPPATASSGAVGSGFRPAPQQQTDAGAASSTGAVPTGAPRSFGPSDREQQRVPPKARPRSARRAPGPSRERFSLLKADGTPIAPPWGHVIEEDPEPDKFPKFPPLGPPPTPSVALPVNDIDQA